MSYQLADGWTDVKFVRPAHGLIALHGSEIVPVQALGLTAGRTTQGHRFEAARATVSIDTADSYATQLRSQAPSSPALPSAVPTSPPNSKPPPPSSASSPSMTTRCWTK